jgi:DNA polymerase III subunit epsilon
MNYVVIDFETTGLDYTKEQIIEVALIKYDKEFKEIGSFNSLVRLQEGRVLSGFIKNLTGLSEEALKDGMKEVDAMQIVLDFIDRDTIVVAQYAPFDLAYMSKYDIVPERYICTKSLTSQVEPTVSSSLIPTCERLGIPLENAHRAFADVRATAELLKYRLNEGEAQFVENYIVKSPDRDLNFVPHGTIQVLDKNSFIKEEN